MRAAALRTTRPRTPLTATPGPPLPARPGPAATPGGPGRIPAAARCPLAAAAGPRGVKEPGQGPAPGSPCPQPGGQREALTPTAQRARPSPPQRPVLFDYTAAVAASFRESSPKVLWHGHSFRSRTAWVAEHTKLFYSFARPKQRF